MWESLLSRPIVVATLLVLAFVLVGFVSTLGKQYERSPPRHAKRLVQSALDWAAVSEQDANPVFAIVHASRAGTFLDAAEQALSAKEMDRTLGVSVQEIRDTIRAVESRSTARLSQECPSLARVTQSPANLFARSV